MVTGNIGPIELDHSEIYDDNSVETSGTEQFTLIATNQQARQIMGLAYSTEKETYNHINMVNTQSNWGVVWVDSSNTLTDNEDITHRGWYIITEAIPTTDLGREYVHLQVTAEKLSSYEHDYLEMDYTPGENDGTIIESSYSDVNHVYPLQDTFTTFDTTDTWSTTVASSMTTVAVTPISGKLNVIGQSDSDGTWGGVFTSSQELMPYPSTLEFDLEWVSAPSGYYHYWELYLTPSKPTTWGAENVNGIRFIVAVMPTKTLFKLSRYASSVKTDWYTYNSLGSSKTPRFKVVVEGGYIYVYWDKTAGGTWTKIYSNTLSSANVSWLANGYYVTYKFENRDSTEATVRSSYCNVYYDSYTSYDNVVALPCTTPITAADFTRYSEDGSIPCYINPTTNLYFWQDNEYYYNGAVKSYNSNYTDSTPQLVTWTDEIIDPDKFYLTNGLIKLTTTPTGSTPILLSSYTSPAGWQDLQIIDPGTITLVKPLYISPERQTYQINDTKWTLSRGKQHFKVEHPYTSLGYTRLDNYYHDTTTTVTPGADTDISMTSQYYTNIYTDGTPCFQIIQIDPTTIKSDSIPAADITGLGWYDPTEASASPGYYSTVAAEFHKQVNQRINLRTL